MMARPSGVDEDNIFYLSSVGFAPDFNPRAAIEQDLDALRSFPGVANAIVTNSVPLQGGGWSQGLRREPGEDIESTGVALYFVDEHGVEALGIRLAAGRAFEAHEIRPAQDNFDDGSQAIVTKAFAKELFPDDPNPLGRTFYSYTDKPIVIVGIIEQMHGAWVGWDKLDNVLMFPRIKTGPNAIYVVRTEPGRRDVAMREIEAKLGNSNPGRLLRWVRPFDYFIHNSYLEDRNMAIFLVSVTSALLAITALGIFGLATFNVSTRIRQIGTRRAVGARKLDIVRHFLVENWMVTTAGIVAGCGAALGIGYWISVKYELPRLDLYYLVGGVLAIWLIGLAAALQPARRASGISPAVASRTV